MHVADDSLSLLVFFQDLLRCAPTVAIDKSLGHGINADGLECLSCTAVVGIAFGVLEMLTIDFIMFGEAIKIAGHIFRRVLVRTVLVIVTTAEVHCHDRRCSYTVKLHIQTAILFDGR